MRVLLVLSLIVGLCYGCEPMGIKFPVKGSCSKYSVCVDTGVPRIMSCPLLHRFDVKKQTCVWGKCISLELDEKCVDMERRPIPGSCAGYTECIGGEMIHLWCPFGQNFDATGLSCKDEATTPCGEGTCRDLERHPIEGDCSHYKECIGGEFIDIPCGPGQRFDPKGLVCKPANQVKCDSQDPTKGCEDMTRRPNQDCSSYDECIAGEYVTMPCPQGEGFDPDTLRCGSGYKCKGSGCVDFTKRAVDDCRWYEECIGDKYLRMTCPPGQGFDPEKLECVVGACQQGNCVEGEKKVVANNCTAYDECVAGALVRVSCGAGFVFDAKLLDCRVRNDQDCPGEKCNEGEIRAQEGEDHYLLCKSGAWTKEQCPRGSLFYGRACKPVQCRELERKPVAENPRGYLECQQGSWVTQTCLLDYKFDPKTLVCTA